jgi:hypothetical protein
MDDNTEKVSTGGDDLLRHIDIHLRLGRRIRPLGWVVAEDDRGGAEFQRALHNLARVDGGVIDSAALLDFIGNQFVFFVSGTGTCGNVLSFHAPWWGGTIIHQAGP